MPTPIAPPVLSSPLPSASTIVNIDVFGDRWIVVGGAPLQMTARVYTRADAPVEFVDDTEHVAWSTEPSGILAIDGQGRVTALASGSARVIASVGDRSGRSPNITAVPDFSGTWSGNYIITACSGHYDFRVCGRLMFSQLDGSRSQYPFSITLSQMQDQVIGTLREQVASSIRETPMRGFVRLSGALVVEASVPQPDLPPFEITNWSATMNPERTRLSGGFTTIEPRRDSLVGTYTIRTENEFSGISRTP